MRVRRSSWGTWSKALEKYIVIAIVREGGLAWLKPLVIMWVRGSRAVVVDHKGLKPCCECTGFRCSSRRGRRSLSSTFTRGEMREMGWYEVPSSAGFPGLGMGMMSAIFQIAGKVAVATDRL